jgi:predicted nucleic acid-binding protein
VSVLVDTSVWVDHFRRPNEELIELLAKDSVMVHSMVVGEVACGRPPDRTETLAALAELQKAQHASLEETMVLLEAEQLFGSGCGFVDMILLASTRITSGATLWTLDNRLVGLAERLGIAHRPTVH